MKSIKNSRHLGERLVSFIERALVRRAHGVLKKEEVEDYQRTFTSTPHCCGIYACPKGLRERADNAPGRKGGKAKRSLGRRVSAT